MKIIKGLMRSMVNKINKVILFFAKAQKLRIALLFNDFCNKGIGQKNKLKCKVYFVSSLKYLLLLLIAGLLTIVSFFIIAGIKDYTPAGTELVRKNTNHSILPDNAELSIMTWNIGYAGLGGDMDFFYDGGKKVRTKKHIAEKNLTAITEVLKKHHNTDIFLLQEVDKKAKRSYRINQYKYLQAELPNFHCSFGKNYDVFYVPVPVFQTMGKVVSGIVNMSRYKPLHSVRYAYPGGYEWPKRLFMPRRCFLVDVYRINNNKELYIINTHHSAFDDGNLKKQEMKKLKNFAVNQYMEGNYIAIGGDWNQMPPDFSPDFNNYMPDSSNVPAIAKDYFLYGWTWAYSDEVPTNRSLNKPFNKQSSGTRTLDFFLLSPNIKLIDVKGIDLGFVNADHQPVKIKIKLQ